MAAATSLLVLFILACAPSQELNREAAGAFQAGSDPYCYCVAVAINCRVGALLMCCCWGVMAKLYIGRLLANEALLQPDELLMKR
jgi:hypothetical protein